MPWVDVAKTIGTVGYNREEQEGESDLGCSAKGKIAILVKQRFFNSLINRTSRIRKPWYVRS